MTSTEDTSHLDIETGVERVAVFLDSDKPGWRDVLIENYGQNLLGLQVYSPLACVLSAVYGDYSIGWRRMQEMGLRNYGHAIACQSSENDMLRNAWLEAVNRRS